MTMHSKLGILLLAAMFTLSGCNGNAEKPQSEQKPHEVAYLLMQSSDSFEYDGKRLTVHGTSPTTIFFSDQPDRIAGHMSLEKAYAWGRSGDDSFVKDPPNVRVPSSR